MADIEPKLAAAVEARRRLLGLSPKDFANATGLTMQGLLPLRKGHRRQYQQRLTDPVCQILGWTPDSIERILAGGKPKLLSSPSTVHVDVRDQVRRLRRAVILLLELAGLDADDVLDGPLEQTEAGL